MSSPPLTRWPLAESDLTLVLDVALAFDHGTMGLLLLRDDESGGLHVAAGRGVTREQWAQFERELGHGGVAGVACTEQRRVCIRDARHDEVAATLAALARAIDFRGIDVHPLQAGDAGVIGALVVLFRWPQRPSGRESALARKCCDLIARALEVQRLYAIEEERRRSAEGLASERLQFVAKMSHELRTPLQSIVGYLELLRHGLPDPVTARQVEMLDRVATSENIVMSVLNDLDNLARLEAGRVDFVPRAVSVRTILDRALAVTAPLARGLGIGMTAAPLPRDLVAWADEAKATQVLVNLLTNAAKFSPRGSVVRIACRRAGDAVHLDVTDSGPGIPDKRLLSIFDPYVQLANRVPKGLEGYGLGLAISREFAEGMHGALTVSSAVGRGTTFTLRLPAFRTRVSRLRPDARPRGRRPSPARSAPPLPADSGSSSGSSASADARRTPGHTLPP